jgi:PadR family transcriptional regulator PadR
MLRRQCRRHGGERPCSCAMGNLYRFVEPVVLHLLVEKESAYGYELAGELNKHALTDAEIDRAALYRTLQGLEANGHVQSTWDVRGSGPARHVYQITESGREHLREWTVVLGNLAKSMEAFVGDVCKTPEQE